MSGPAQKQNQKKGPSRQAPSQALTPEPQRASSILSLPRAIGNRALRRMIGTPGSIPKTAAQGATGGGGSLPYLSQIQRSFGRHDVSHVRAHQDSRAGAAARAIGARAYTLGDRVAFAGVPDLRTAAHEAAHVVQQRAGVQLAGDVGKVGDVYERHADAVADLVTSGRSAESLLDRMAPRGSRALAVQRQVVQRTPIETNFGKFDTTKYKSTGPKGGRDGVDIVLTFDPDPVKVDAKKIGLTQSVRTQLAGTEVSLFPLDRMVPSGTGKGSQIDQYGGRPYGNPLYATGKSKATDKLEDTRTHSNWGRHGWSYKDGAGKLHHRKAILKDSPAAPGRGKNSSQLFESAALAVEGAQSGTYMGSVSWGWSVDGRGKFKREPLTLKSMGDPSAEFVEAAKQWNTTAVGGIVKTTADPTNVYNKSYSVSFTVAKDTEVRVIEAAPIHRNITYDRVRIISGPKAGKKGRIKVNDLKQTGGTPVVKLPIP